MAAVRGICVYRCPRINVWVSTHIQVQGPQARLSNSRAALCRADRFPLRQQKIGPCLQTSGQGSPLFLCSQRPRNRGGWRAEQGAWPGLLRAVTGLRRSMGVKRHAPRLAARQRGILGLRLSQRSGRARSYVSLEGCSRGRPWVGLA
jgi:hypothetical protein